MNRLYNVSVIGKYDLWLREDEENPANWVVMSVGQLEQYAKLRQRGLWGQ